MASNVSYISTYESNLTLAQLNESNVSVNSEMSVQLFEQMLTVLKKLEYHLYLGTDTELNDQDV